MTKLSKIFVGATRQHVGKTTTSLGIMNGIVKRYGAEKVGFIKPVGQQHENINGALIDKDARLMKEYFNLSPSQYKDMSPVVIPAGYTRKYIDGEITNEQQIERIMSSYNNTVDNGAEFILMEGSGHCGVGSVVDMNNARVASLLDSEMLLIANGGLGKAFDELDLNRLMCKEYDVKIRGVVINKVLHNKVEMIREYMEKLLKRWDIPLIGVVPDQPYLSQPTLLNFEQLLKTELIAGTEHRGRHFDQKDILSVATSLNLFLIKAEEMRSKEICRPLLVTHISRSDIILGFASHYIQARNKGSNWEGALILTGKEEQSKELDYIYDVIRLEGIPAMHCKKPTAEVMFIIQNFVSKLNIGDPKRIEKAISHYEPHIDFEKLLG